MIGWLYRIIVGYFDKCDHQWETEEVYRVLDDNGNIIGRAVYAKCKICGKPHRFNQY